MTPRSRHVLTPLPPRNKEMVAEPENNDDENQIVPFSSDDDDCKDEQNNNNRQPMFEKRPSPSTLDTRVIETQQVDECLEVWDESSRESVSSFDSDSDEDKQERIGTHRARKTSEQPEIQRKSSAQQSEEESSDDEAMKPSTASTTSPSPAAASVDLSRLSKLAVFPGSETKLIQGHILRVKTMLSCQYHFYIDDQLLLMAEKQITNRTSNYHIFDMTRSIALSSKLSKKSGNYIGKLRSNFSRKKSVLIGNVSRKTELGAMVFSKTFTSTEPRQLTVILPPLTRHDEIEGLTVGDSLSSFSMLIDLYQSMTDKTMTVAHSALRPDSLQVFVNKDPVFENGFYRLNFNGRVSVPSVKNFQLVDSAHEQQGGGGPNSLLLQFGKVNDTKFHLDFRAPLTPIQAFAAAIAQFNL